MGMALDSLQLSAWLLTSYHISQPLASIKAREEAMKMAGGLLEDATTPFSSLAFPCSSMSRCMRSDERHCSGVCGGVGMSPAHMFGPRGIPSDLDARPGSLWCCGKPLWI